MPDTERVVLVTGGAGGIGRATAQAFGARGARVVLLDIDGPATEAVATDLGVAGIEALPLACDLTDPAACAGAVATVLERWGRIDVLVNNAGISHRSLFRDTDPAVLRQVMEVNFFGTVNITRAALDALIAQRGHVVAVTSVAGFAPLLGRTAYAASKHALHGFFDTLREELRPSGVGVSLVCPSFVDTPLRHTAMAGDGTPVTAEKAEVGRVLSPSEVAEAIVLATERRTRQVVLSPVGKATWWLSRLVPATYARLMRRTQLREFAGQSG